MYNEKRKNEFIEWYSTNTNTSSNYIPNLFNKVEYMEEKYGTDISEFNLELIVALLKSFKAPSINSLRIVVSILRTYTKWCTENRYIMTDNNYLLITTDILLECVDKEIINKKIFTWEQLDAFADGLLNVCDKYLIYAVAEGMKGDNYCEVLNLRECDIDRKNMTFHLCTGRTIKVSPQLMNYASASVKEFQYFSTKEDSFFVSELKEDSDLVFKPRNNSVNETPDGAYHRLLKRIFKIKSELGVAELTLPRLFNSGVVNSIINGAKLLNISTTSFLENEAFAAIRERYNLDQPLFTLRGMYKEYLD